jgi:hypothetical protein
VTSAVPLSPQPATEPQIAVLDVGHVRHAAAPTLRFDLHLTEPLGREVHVGALSVQIMVDPARRTYDDATRAKLVELFGAPERWASTTHSFQWARIETLVPAFTGATSFPLEVPCTYDLEIAASKYFYSLPGGFAPLSFHLTGMLLYAGEGDRLQIMQVPWSCSARYDLEVDAWKRVIHEYYPHGGWVRLQTETLDRLAARKAAGSHHSFDDCVGALLDAEGPS